MRPHPRYALLLIALSASYLRAQDPVVIADNGITASGSSTTRKVSLGGTLTGNTTIPFGGFNLLFSGTGNFGIRTTNPFAPLHVAKSVSGDFNPTMIVEDTYTQGYTMFQMRGTGQVYHLGVGNHSETANSLANKFFIWDNTVGAARLVVNATGQVGIGTNSPGSLLDVNGASRFRNNLTADFGTTNRRTQLRDNGLFMSRTSDGQYLSSIVADGNMDLNTRNHYRFFSDGVEIVSMQNGGNVGIGVVAPNQKLHVNGTVYGTGYKLDAGNNIFWGDPNTHITRNIGNELELQEHTGAIRLKGNSGLNFILQHPTNGLVNFNFPSHQTFALNNKGAKILETSATNQSNLWIKLGASDPHFTDGPGTNLFLFGGIGGANGVQNGGSVYLDGGVKGSVSAQNGNIILGNTTGNVLVGTATNNGNKFQVNGTTYTTGLIIPTGAAAGKVLTSDGSGNATWQTAAAGGNFWPVLAPVSNKQIGNTTSENLEIITNNSARIFIASTGEVGIGTFDVPAAYKLSVEGSVRARKIRVDAASWPDYVFHPTYRLRPLHEVELFIKTNSHLPEVPSAEEVQKEGIDLGDNQAVLLKKIEELTLYIIEQNKRLEAVEKELKQLKKK